MSEKQEMIKRLMCDAKTPEEAKRHVVLCNRIMANEGILCSLGHVSCRNPDNPETFFISCSRSPEFVTVDDIMEVAALDGAIVQSKEGQKPYSERVLHGAIYSVRKDVNAVYHGHPLPVVPFTTCKDKPLLPVMMYGSIFYDGYGYFDDADVSNGMLVRTMEEGVRVARALGNKYACLLRGHGLVVVAENIPQLMIDSIWLINNAKVQIDCEAIGGTPKLCTWEEGYALREALHGENALTRIWDYHLGRAKKTFPDIVNL